MSQDERYLDLLAIFHYVVGGLTGLFACFPIIHLIVGLVFLFGEFDSPDAPPRLVGLIFVIFPGFIILAGWTLAGFIIAAGRRLKSRRSHLFCLVVAGVECIVMPFGTVLGVLTIVMLMKDSVKQLFDKNEATYDNFANGQ